SRIDDSEFNVPERIMPSCLQWSIPPFPSSLTNRQAVETQTNRQSALCTSSSRQLISGHFTSGSVLMSDNWCETKIDRLDSVDCLVDLFHSNVFHRGKRGETSYDILVRTCGDDDTKVIQQLNKFFGKHIEERLSSLWITTFIKPVKDSNNRSNSGNL